MRQSAAPTHRFGCGSSDSCTAVCIEIMAAPAYLNQPVEIVSRALTGQIDGGTQLVSIPDFYVPHAGAANFPWKSHGLWYYSQMVRWGEVGFSAANAAIAAATFRPDLYRAALASLGVAVPAQDLRVDGDQADKHAASAIGGTLELGPNRFFDGVAYHRNPGG